MQLNGGRPIQQPPPHCQMEAPLEHAAPRHSSALLGPRCSTRSRHCTWLRLIGKVEELHEDGVLGGFPRWNFHPRSNLERVRGLGGAPAASVLAARHTSTAMRMSMYLQVSGTQPAYARVPCAAGYAHLYIIDAHMCARASSHLHGRARAPAGVSPSVYSTVVESPSAQVADNFVMRATVLRLCAFLKSLNGY